MNIAANTQQSQTTFLRIDFLLDSIFLHMIRYLLLLGLQVLVGPLPLHEGVFHILSFRLSRNLRPH